MQQVKESTAASKQGNVQAQLRDRKVKDLMVGKRRLVEVPYTATLIQTMNTLVANQVVALPVAAQPGQWIGAGGSMIMESDKQTGVVTKHYIGMVTMLDILAHLAGDNQINGGGAANHLDQRMSVPVSSIIGHCLEGLNLWTLNPTTSLLDCMKFFSKGIHRALVPIDSQLQNVSGVELVESASAYRMLTQMDVMIFLREHASELRDIVTRGVEDLGAVTESVYAITEHTTVNEAIHCMRAAMLNAVPIVKASETVAQCHSQSQLIDGKYMKLVGTFSATDLRGCHFATLSSWFPLSVFEFTQTISSSPPSVASAVSPSPREQVTCHMQSPLSEVIAKAIDKHVHRVWVVDEQGLLVGVVSLTDVIRVLRLQLLSDTIM